LPDNSPDDLVQENSDKPVEEKKEVIVPEEVDPSESAPVEPISARMTDPNEPVAVQLINGNVALTTVPEKFTAEMGTASP